MCGIAGKLYFESDRPVEAAGLSAMSNRILHRGPDDEGMYLKGNVGLAVRRLAIIDLEGGRQPIHNETRTVWVVFNGEIYDFQELRRLLEQQGHSFYTHSDTEVLVHLYEEYDLDFVRHLNGMFAIALWDERKQRLVLVRDHLGIKPLFYAFFADRLLFGSEIKAIRVEQPLLTINPRAVDYYFSLLYIPSPDTIYQEIRKLEPGHMLVWEAGCSNIQSYWNLADIETRRDGSKARLFEELHELLSASIRRQLVADVPVGVFLSGGLDSSTVAALARRVARGRLQTLTIGFDDPSYNETRYARLMAQRLGTDHTELVVHPDPNVIAEKLAVTFDEPFGDSSAIPMYYLSELTRRHVKVALSGDGGDELFAGYLTYQADKLAHLYDRVPGVLSRQLVPALVKRLPVSDAKVSFDFKARRFVENALLEPGERHFAWKAFFDPQLKRSLLHPDLLAAMGGQLDGYLPYRRHYEAVSHLDEISRFQYADTKVYLPDDNLLKVDHMSMAHSVEVRVPLLDRQVVEFAFRLPGGLKMPRLALKHFLREAMPDLLPAEIRHRSKRGFSVPMARWLRTDLRPLVERYLSVEVVRAQRYLQADTVSKLVALHMMGRMDYSRNLWGLLMFNLWVEQAQMERN